MRVHKSQPGEVHFIVTSISRKQAVRLDERMSADQEVRNDSPPRRQQPMTVRTPRACLSSAMRAGFRERVLSLFPIGFPCLGGRSQGVHVKLADRDTSITEKGSHILRVFEVRCQFRVDDWANDRRAGLHGRQQRLSGGLDMLRIIKQNIDEHIRVNASRHLPRSS